MNLLIIRPQPGADATAARVRMAGHRPMLMPLFEVRPVAWDEPDPETFDALLITSGNAVRMSGDGLRRLKSLPVIAVGAATASAANKAGLEVGVSGEAGVSAVIAKARSAGARRLLWLSGEDRTEVSVPEDMVLDVRTVYRSVALSTPDHFAERVADTAATLLHSPRAATHFAELCHLQGVDRGSVSLAALSPAIARNAGEGWKCVTASPEPNDAALLSQLQSCFTNIVDAP